MSYEPGNTLDRVFTTNSSTGALVNADALPTAALLHNGAVDNTVSVTVSNISTGNYLATCIIPSTYAAGDKIQLSVAATVSSVAGGAVFESWVLNAAGTASANALIAGATGQNTGIIASAWDATTGNPTVYSLYLYDTAAHAATNDGSTGVLHKFSVVDTYVTGNLHSRSCSMVS